jgi:hypothetical protein
MLPWEDWGVLDSHTAPGPGELPVLDCGPGEWAADMLLISPCGRPARGDPGAWLDAGPGVACKCLLCWLH